MSDPLNPLGSIWYHLETFPIPQDFLLYFTTRNILWRGLSEHNKTLFFFVYCCQWLLLLESQSAIKALALLFTNKVQYKTPKNFNFYLLPRPRGLSEHKKT